MKNITVLIFTAGLITECNGQHDKGKIHGSHTSTRHNHSSGSEQENIEDLEANIVETFPTVGFKVIYKDTISYSVKDVFPLFEPQGRNLLYKDWDPTELRKGEPENSIAITWLEYNAGLYEKGVPLVSMFVEEGHLVKAVKRYISNIENQLKNGK